MQKQAEKLAKHIARHGLDKKARSSSWGRLWASLSMRPGFVVVGINGKGQPLVEVPLTNAFKK